MPPQTLHDSGPATDSVVAAETGSGRHRRPETLADASRLRVPAARPANVSRSAGTRSARHQRPVGGPRHRAAGERPPVTGNHRAPGTLPIESWLLMGKKRQQVLLASLVAAGLLLLALPTGRAVTGVDAVNAAAQRAVGTHTSQSKKDTGPDNGGGAKKPADSGRNDDKGAPAAKPTVPAVPGVAVTGPAKHDDRAAGPGSSLRTTGSRAIALTFDDGPDPVQTPKILAMLDQYQIKATFCLVGQQVRKHPEVVREIVAAGHTLCNHTWNHSLTIGKDDPAKIQDDLARTSAAIEAAAPGAEIPFFRAPGGNFTDRLVSVAASGGMTSLYWQVDPQDWKHTEGETDEAHIARVIAEVKKHVRPGSIVLSHDFNQPDTVAAYQKLLPWLTENFTLGIPGRPAPASSPTPEPTSPAPTETPASPEPSASVSPAPAAS